MHPRIVNNEGTTVTYKKLPLCSAVGMLYEEFQLTDKKLKDFEQHLGLGVSLYFKVVRFFTIVLFICTILMIPYLAVFT